VEYHFEVLSKLNRKIRTTTRYWQKIVTLKHPVMAGQDNKVIKTLKYPDTVKLSEKDDKVFLYYKKFAEKYICVVVRHEDGKGFVISTFPVDKIRIGTKVYEKS